jgi:hypothetical protein
MPGKDQIGDISIITQLPGKSYTGSKGIRCILVKFLYMNPQWDPETLALHNAVLAEKMSPEYRAH